MLPVLLFAAAAAVVQATASQAKAVQPIVSTEWLQAHLEDPNVRVVDVSQRGAYDALHIDGAAFVDHMDTVNSDHRPLPPDAMAKAWAKAGVGDATHVVLYGDSPMGTGWMYMMLASIGHGDRVSMLDGGIKLWEAEKRPTSKTEPRFAAAKLTVRPAPNTIVDAAWVRARLQSPDVKILDVRTTQEWNNGRLPNATLILWQDLFADRQMLKFKSTAEIKALIERAGWKPGQEAVTYCAVGMRASLMQFAARAAGIPTRVYLGSWQDWSRDAKNPVVK
jgi:thiosulfate/3-mercaptopyruvate sulfurtransferase